MFNMTENTSFKHSDKASDTDTTKHVTFSLYPSAPTLESLPRLSTNMSTNMPTDVPTNKNMSENKLVKTVDSAIPRWFKIVNQEKQHRGFQYKEGLNCL